MPRRIQRRRTKGWRMPDGAVYVGRPSHWGNPYRVVDLGSRHVALDGPEEGRWAVTRGSVTGRAVESIHEDKRAAREAAVVSYRRWATEGPDHYWRVLGYVDALKGRDLACWCPPGHPCHADVLLELANGGI